MTSTELSEKAGVRISYLSEIEHDRTIHPKEEYLEKLTDALEVPLQDILGRHMPPKDDGGITTPSSYQGVAGGDGQGSGVATYSAARPAISIRSLPSSTIGRQIEHLIASADLSEEEVKDVGTALIKITKHLITLMELQQEREKGSRGNESRNRRKSAISSPPSNSSSRTRV
jgi:transcriptional regulator with XRE-family HTH domain